jgi:hypothetical protein
MSSSPVATFDFHRAFAALIAQAEGRRPGQRKRSRYFPEIHEVCIDRSAVVELAHLAGHEARVERYLDSAGELSAAYGWSVDAIARTLDRFTTVLPAPPEAP